MKKIIYALLVLFTICLFGCNENAEINIEDIEIKCNEEYYVDEFNINDIKLAVKYNNGEEETLSLTNTMVSESDIEKLTKIGSHEITISYKDKEIKQKVKIIDKIMVTFKVNDEIIDEQKIKKGETVSSPKPKQIEGYNFIGWDKELTNIKEDTTINAIYEEISYEVVFLGLEGKELGTQKIKPGEKAVEPKEYEEEGYIFKGWDKEFSNITENTIISAIYEKKEYEVSFLNIDNEIISKQIVKYGESAEIPNMRDIGIYKFDGWEEDPTKVTKETVFKPIYTKNVLEFSEELRAQFVEQCDFGSYECYDLENAEILNVLRDKWYIVYVPYLLPYLVWNHYFNGFTYQEIGDVYFEYYKEYAGLLILWSPDKSFGSEKWLHSYERYMRWVYSSPVVEILTSEEIESISWPKYKESELPNNPNYIDDINDEMKNELSSKLYTYLEEKGKNIEGFHAHNDVTYCGTYDDVVLFYGYDPILVTATFSAHVYYERIDDRVLVYSNSKCERIYAYKDGKVYTLKEAYDEGFVSFETVCKIPDTVYTYYEKALLNDSSSVHWI